MKKTEKFMFRLETNAVEVMEKIAEAQHRTVASVARQAIAEWLQARKTDRIKPQN